HTTKIERLADAQDANAREHDLSFFQALRLYPKGVLWSIILSTTVVMEGYDTKLIGTFFAQPAFQKAFGHQVKPGSYQVSAPWQTALANGSAVGQILGLLLAGSLSERYGFRKTLIAGLVIITGLIFMSFFAPNIIVLEIGQTLIGIPLGLFQTTPVIYALEISPMCLRAYLTNYVNFCWAFGQIICIGTLRGTLHIEGHWSYRIGFAVQWFWPVLLIPLITLAPESPWWLVRKGRLEEAKAVVQSLTSPENVDFDVEKNVALMVVTTEHERAIDAETSYKACFKGLNLRRTLVVIGIYCIQVLNGNSLRGYSTYFLTQAGLPTTQAFNMAIIGYAIAIVGGFFSWVLLPLFGRRSIYNCSLAMMLVIMIIIGALGFPQAETKKPGYAWAIGSILIVSSFLYNCSIGPLTNTLCSEIPSALLRSKSIVLARSVYVVGTIIANVLTPYQLNPTAWHWGAKTGLFWAGGCIISLVFAYFCLPETKNRTTAEIDILFEKKTSARKFAKTPVDLMEEIGNGTVKGA
ncbi:general substrate transporter, partial [Pyrenochaeta sp. MPI-SDFR-AT-0127]